MKSAFDSDPFPTAPRILFVGLSESSHTHAWIDLLAGTPINTRLFALPTGIPPDSWKIKTYVTSQPKRNFDPAVRAEIPVRSKKRRLVSKVRAIIRRRPFVDEPEGRWLAKVMQEWRPHIVHTLGLDSGSFFFSDLATKYGLHGKSTWVVQARGGPDLALHRLLPEFRPRIHEVLQRCDQFIADNRQNYDYALELGLTRERVSPLGVVPGTGGIDLTTFEESYRVPPSKRERIILWPKAYECPQGKALPVFEAFTSVWDKIKPCKIYMTAAIRETCMWFRTLPREIQESSEIMERIPRSQLMTLLSRARILLAPSLADGIPNSLYEAMAAGTFPIVSPLETIASVVKEGENVLFARNLYISEIGLALVRAMTDDLLVDRAAHNNRALVKELADRDAIRKRVVEYYKNLSGVN